MHELLYVTPPTVQAGKLLSARVGNIWSDDTIWLDGIARAPRALWEYWDYTDPHDGTSERDMAEFRILHAPICYTYLIWSLKHAQTGSGTSTLRLYYRDNLVLQNTRTSAGETTLVSGANISSYVPGAWAMSKVRLTLQCTGGASARAAILYIAERSVCPVSYQTPQLFSSGTVYTAAQFNTIPAAIGALNAIARWPVYGFRRRVGEWYEGASEQTIATWTGKHHGDTLHYHITIAKDGSNLRRKINVRIYYAGTAVKTLSYSGAWTEGEDFSGTVSLAGLGVQENDDVTVSVTYWTEGAMSDPTAGKGKVWVNYLGTSYAGYALAPPKATATGYVTATDLNYIASVLADMANDTGGGYNDGGRAYMLGYNLAWKTLPPGPTTGRTRVYLLRTGWPTLRYRAKKATLRWGENGQESVGLTDSPKAWASYNTVDLDGLKGLAPGMLYWMESETGEIDYVAETRS